MFHETVGHPAEIVDLIRGVCARRLRRRQRLMRGVRIVGVGLHCRELRIQYSSRDPIALRLRLRDRRLQRFRDRISRCALQRIGADDLPHVAELLLWSPGVGYCLIQVRSCLIVLSLQRGNLGQSCVRLGKSWRERRGRLVVCSGVGKVAVPLQKLGVGVVRIGRIRKKLDLAFRGSECSGFIAGSPGLIGESVVTDGVVRILGHELACRRERRPERARNLPRDEWIRGYQL